MIDTITFRKLNTDDVSQYKAIRLEALDDSPQAFGSTSELESVQDDAFFISRIENAYIVGAFIEEHLVATGGVFYHKDTKREHKASIWGVYVTPPHRNKGIAKRVISKVLEYLPETIEQVMLCVESTNSFAIRTYKNLGFEEYGYEKHALKVREHYYDEVMMVKFV